jgi:hypothetical protein
MQDLLRSLGFDGAINTNVVAVTGPEPTRGKRYVPGAAN